MSGRDIVRGVDVADQSRTLALQSNVISSAGSKSSSTQLFHYRGRPHGGSPVGFRGHMNDATDRRAKPRRSLDTVIPIHVGAYAGRLLDVSDIGLRFELASPSED